MKTPGFVVKVKSKRRETIVGRISSIEELP